VVGDAGVGKSRLCLEFVKRCRARGVVVYEAHCPAHGATVPWLAIRDLLRSCFALGPDERVGAVPRRVEERLEALGAGLRDEAPLVLEVLGVNEPTVAHPSAQSVAARLAAFMQRFVRLRSAEEPILVLLDDAHWIDPASADVVREIAASVRDTRALLLANFRPEYRPAWIGGASYHQLALSPLGEEACRELLRDLLGSHGSLGELPDRIREHTAG